MTRPLLGLAISPPSDPMLERFLAVIARWTIVRQAYASDAVDGWLVTDDIDPDQISSGRPVLVWARDAGRAVASRWPDAIIIAPLRDGAPHALLVPDPSIDVTAIPYVAPLVRGRWRQRYGLPSDLVVRVDDAGADVSMSLRPTALAVAAVVIATGNAVLSALAWGAPTVTDRETERRLRLGRAVEAVDAAHLLEAAHQLTQSETRMAELAWLGRSLVEDAFDVARVAYTALHMAGLATPDSERRDIVSRFEELWATPETSWSIIRAISS